jgi:hypothetical protein
MHEACCNLLDYTNQLQRACSIRCTVQERMLYFVNCTPLTSTCTESRAHFVNMGRTFGDCGLVLPLLTDGLSGTG